MRQVVCRHDEKIQVVITDKFLESDDGVGKQDKGDACDKQPFRKCRKPNTRCRRKRDAGYQQVKEHGCH